jgi:hypothetical protein
MGYMKREHHEDLELIQAELLEENPTLTQDELYEASIDRFWSIVDGNIEADEAYRERQAEIAQQHGL